MRQPATAKTQQDANREPAAEPLGAAARAVIYLRVSSAQQADKDYDPDGYSLPAQKEACLRKATSLDLHVVEEFVDRGESGRTANRPGLQALLTRIEQGDIQTVLVHKLDRLARNRADDVAIVMRIRAAGAQLVSVTENIDETPSGVLLHGIMSSIAEFYSRNLATEIMKGTTQKAKRGGTPFRAPVGYLNTREIIDDREIRTIAIDPERAPLVRLAFEMYATGNYSLIELAAILEARGLRSRASRKQPAKPLGPNRLSAMLNNDYYVGVVHYAGGSYQGRHEPLIDQPTFDRVRHVLASQRQSGERSWIHHNHMRGTLYCAQCGGRLFFSRNRGRHGGTYDYYVCGGRAAHTCTQPHHRAEAVEGAVEHHYATIEIAPERQEQVRELLRSHLDEIGQMAERETAKARAELTRLDNQERKLLAAHYADRISDHIFTEEQTRIRRERAAADTLLKHHHQDHETALKTLDLALKLTTDIQRAYLNAAPNERRLLNQGLFERIEIDTEEIADHALTEPFQQIAALNDHLDHALSPRDGRTPATPDKDGGSYLQLLVELGGLEPPTSWVRSRRSPN
jgi:site-specific DNA recombinase